VRTRLVSHWLGCADADLDATLAATGSLGAAIEQLRAEGRCRLRPIPVLELKPLANLIATFHVGDPVGPRDSWRPWLRRRSLKAELKTVVNRLKRARMPSTAARLSAKTV
jgi:hypothetical protein